MLDRLGLDFDPAKIQNSKGVNVSSAKIGGMDWAPDLRQQVIEAEAGAMKRFGYE